MMLLLEMFPAHKRRVAYKSELRRFKIAEIRAQVAALKLANMGGIGGTRVVHSRPSSPTTPADAPERGRERRDRGKGDRGGRGGAGGGLETAGKATRPSSSTSRPAAFGIRLPSAYDVHAPTHEANQHLSYQEFKGLYEYN